MVNLRLKSKEKTFDKGTVIISKGQILNQTIIIISGSVREQFNEFYLTRGIGNIVNAYDITYEHPSKCEVVARNTIKVHEIDRAYIIELLKSNLVFRKTWYKSIFPYCLRLLPGMEKMKSELSDREMRRFIEAADVILLNTGDSGMIEIVGYVLDGSLVTMDVE